jgi:glycosyltransferase involved in cell wall biosynthesis
LAGAFLNRANRRRVRFAPSIGRHGIPRHAAAADVSVIIPCYRCVATLGRAIDSVLAQTRLPREIVLVDDCSGDDTFDTMNVFAASLGREWVTVVSLPRNLGAGEARNAGWACAKSTYIAFLDADDYWHPGKIDLQYSWMRQRPHVAITGHRWQLEELNSNEPARKEEHNLARRIGRFSFLLSNRFSTPTVMLRRDIPIRFAANKRYAEDYYLWLSIVLRDFEAWLLDVSLVRLAKSPISTTGLSSHLLRMERGELGMYKRLYNEGLISWPMFLCMTGWSVLKFGRRLTLHLLKWSLSR